MKIPIEQNKKDLWIKYVSKTITLLPENTNWDLLDLYIYSLLNH